LVLLLFAIVACSGSDKQCCAAVQRTASFLQVQAFSAAWQSSVIVLAFTPQGPQGLGQDHMLGCVRNLLGQRLYACDLR